MPGYLHWHKKRHENLIIDFLHFFAIFVKSNRKKKVPSLKIENKYLPSVIELSWPEIDDNLATSKKINNLHKNIYEKLVDNLLLWSM